MSQPAMMKCPRCSQLVKAEWGSCRSCGEQLSTQAPMQQTDETAPHIPLPAESEKKGFSRWLSNILKR